MDDFSSVRYVKETSEKAISLIDAPHEQVKHEVTDWIELRDENELPSELM